MEEYTFKTTDLASRKSAAATRIEVESMISEHGFVELNLAEVESISDSYADELFGVLSFQIGYKQLIDSVKLLNVKQTVARSIASAVQRRSFPSVA